MKQQPEGVFRRSVPGTTGSQYILKTSAWIGAKPTITNITGIGANQAVGALGNTSDEALAIAARARWGNRIKFAGRVGGRFLVIVGVGNSAYEIYTAEAKAREITRQVSGWTAAGFGAKYGAASGAGLGATIAGAAGQMGPQVLAPEEVVTVPVASGIGGLIGGFGGAIGGWWFGTTVADTVYDWTFQRGAHPAGVK